MPVSPPAKGHIHHGFKLCGFCACPLTIPPTAKNGNMTVPSRNHFILTVTINVTSPKFEEGKFLG